MGLKLELDVKNYEGDLAATFAAINSERLAHITPTDKTIWQFIANNMRTNVKGPIHDQGSEETILVRILGPQVYEQTHPLLRMDQGMGYPQTQIDLPLLAYTLICLTDCAVTRYLRFSKVSKISILQTAKEQYALVLLNMSNAQY